MSKRIDIKDHKLDHCVFYYYGINHLTVSLNYYLQKFNNLHRIYFGLADEKYNILINKLSCNNKSNNIYFNNVNDIILKYKNDVNSIKRKIKEREIENERTYWIVDASYFINHNSREELLFWEKKASEVFTNVKSNLICIYDFQDFLKNKKFIDERVIKKSYDIHNLILNKHFFKKIDILCKV